MFLQDLRRTRPARIRSSFPSRWSPKSCAGSFLRSYPRRNLRLKHAQRSQMLAHLLDRIGIDLNLNRSPAAPCGARDVRFQIVEEYDRRRLDARRALDVLVNLMARLAQAKEVTRKVIRQPLHRQIIRIVGIEHLSPVRLGRV